jgi:hypothetical protein
MFPKSGDQTLKGPHTLGVAEISPQRNSRRSLLVTLGVGAFVAASVAAGLGGSATAAAGDNPPPGLMAKIQIATYGTNRMTTLSGAPRKPSLNRAFRTVPHRN